MLLLIGIVNDKEYSDIFKIYGFDNQGKFIYNTSERKFVKVYILLPEYVTREEPDEI